MSDSPWIEVTVTAPAAVHELLATLLAAPPFTAVEFTERGLRTFADRGDVAPGFEAALRARLASAVARSGLAPGDAVAVAIADLPRVDWERAWREGLRPFRVGRVCIAPDDATPRLRAGDVSLRLTPGDAFGTGRHRSTRVALRGLQQGLRAGERVLDVGCGSGILAVAAALLGAREVTGIDDDPIACRAALELARANGVAARCRFEVADLAAFEATGGRFDGFAANLYFDLVQRHAARLARLLAPGGWFTIAGLRASEGERTARALDEAGLGIVTERGSAKWVGFFGRKRAGAEEVVPSVGLEPTTR